MDRFKKSLLILLGLLLLNAAAPAPPVSQGQGPPFGPRKFYLTPTQHRGNTALTACAKGYHMASLWEIFDPSNLRYDTGLGVTLDDSGFGPPNGEVGWIRTGNHRNVQPGSPAGSANCQAWTSIGFADEGTIAHLEANWEVGSFVSPVSPWRASTFDCFSLRHVWCVQD